MPLPTRFVSRQFQEGSLSASIHRQIPIGTHPDKIPGWHIIAQFSDVQPNVNSWGLSGMESCSFLVDTIPYRGR